MAVEVETDIPASTIERLESGAPVVYPTSTLPGLGCLPVAHALDRLFEVKGRDAAKVVSLGVASMEQAESIAIVPEGVKSLIQAFPRGALTVIVSARETMDARLGGDAIAIRVLAHPVARALAERVGPITATSANPAGEADEEDVHAAAAALGLPAEAVLAGGCEGGRPSTLIRWSDSDDSVSDEVVVLREGVVSEKEVLDWPKNRI